MPPSQALAQEKPLLEAPVVDWSVANAVYQQADQWIEKGRVERNPTQRPLLISGVVGVRVTLRFGGLTVAVADALGNPDKPQTPVDLRELAARATELALVKYKDARDNALTSDDGKNPGAKSKGSRNGPRENDAILLDLDMQIAHAPVEIILPPSAAPKTIYYQFAAGHHGLRLISTATPAVSSMIWPANALASNLLPDSQITQLLADAGYSASDILNMPEKIGREGGPRLQRLEVIHLVRPFHGQPVAQLTRGNDLIPLDAVDQRTIDAMARRLTRHLASRIILEGARPGTVAGTYHPTTDRYDPIEASPTDAALTAYALARRALYLSQLDSNSVEFLNTREKSRVILDDLRKSLVDLKPHEGDAIAKAMVMLTLIEMPWLSELKNDRDKLGSALMNLPQDKGTFLNPATRQVYPAEGQAIVLASLTALYEQTRDDKLPAILEPGLDALWGSKLGTADLVSAMPWMAQATTRLHQINLAQQTDPTAKAFERQRWAARSAAMQTLSEALRTKRLVTSKPKLGPADVVGGYDLINDTADGIPAPDYRSANVLAFLSHQASQPALMESYGANQFRYDATLTVRFLAQLMIDEPSCFYIRGARADAIDAVRLALWDNRLSPKPSAMTLLAITLLQETVAQKK